MPNAGRRAAERGVESTAKAISRYDSMRPHCDRKDLLRVACADSSLDRTTSIGQMISSYLSGQSEQEDHVIHLLFSANRWEAA
jgi:hypothetical protein